MLVKNPQKKTMDYESKNLTITNVCRQFEVKKIIKSIDKSEDVASLLVEVHESNAKRYCFELPTSSIVAIDSLISRLSTNGLTLDHYMNHSASMYLMEGYRMCQQNDMYEYRHSSLGWFEYNGRNLFLYDKTAVDESHVSKYTKPFKFKNGNEKEYIDFIKNEMFSVPTLALALSIGYSAVVSSKLKDSCDIGTIIVNLCGASSTGKTTAEQLLVSPFACPVISNKYGLVHTFHSTTNALFESIDGIHGLPIVLDDITTNKNINVENLLYTISSGEEKMRCQQDGSLKESKSGFDGVVVISSEYPVYELASENQGLKARVIHTQGITWTPNAETAERIKEFVSNNYGFTGVDFANYVTKIKNLKSRYDQAKKETHKLMPKRDNLSDRLESKYAIFYLTIELLNECFELNLNVCEIMKILIAPEQESLEERDIGKKALGIINDYVIKKMKHFKILNHDQKFNDCRDSTGDHLGTIRYEGRKMEIFIPTADINALLKAGGINEFVSVKKKWINDGILLADTGRTDCKHLGRRCYHFVFEHNIMTDFEEIEKQVTKNDNTIINNAPPVVSINYDGD